MGAPRDTFARPQRPVMSSQYWCGTWGYCRMSLEASVCGVMALALQGMASPAPPTGVAQMAAAQMVRSRTFRPHLPISPLPSHPHCSNVQQIRQWMSKE